MPSPPKSIPPPPGPLLELRVGEVDAVVAHALGELERGVLEGLSVLRVELSADGFEERAAFLLGSLEVGVVGVDGPAGADLEAGPALALL